MPESAVVIVAGCADCTQDLEHCHGTLIRHPDGFTECADDPGCGCGVDLHVFGICCDETGCLCAEPEPASLLDRVSA
jgi:hypothetical protein